jgi:quinol monooxygenase YgiN
MPTASNEREQAMDKTSVQRVVIRGALGCLILAAIGCSSSDDDSSPSQKKPEYIALIRGTLAGSDLAAAKSAHDQIASLGKPPADIGHDAMLGTTLLDSKENEFKAIDRWTDLDAMKQFYADPQIQQAFGGLFSAPPTVEYFVNAPDWVNWGDLRSGDAYPTYYDHLALGTLAPSDIEEAHAEHDGVASHGKDPSLAAGNVAHVVYLGVDEPHRFVAVDIWKSSDNIQGFYSDPGFVAAFAPLFESVTQPVYRSTDWYQW